MAGEDALQIRVTADFKEVESAFLNLGKTAKSFEGDIRKVAGNVSKEFNRIEGTATLFGNSANVVKDKMDVLRGAMERLMSTGLQPANKYVQELKTKYDSLAASLVVVDTEAKKVNKTIDSTANSIKKSNQQYTNFALVLQDLPYGFRGIQNNLPALMGGIAGMAGPLYLVGSAIIALFTAWDQGSFKALMATDKLAEAHKKNAEAIAKGADAEAKAIIEMQKLRDIFTSVKDNSVTAADGLREYNKAVGDTWGTAKNLNEAESEFIKKSQAYVQATALRAMADEKYAQAAEAFKKGRLAEGTDQVGFFKKLWIAAGASESVGLMGFDPASLSKWISVFYKNVAYAQRDGANQVKKQSQEDFDVLTKQGMSLKAEANKKLTDVGIKPYGEETTKTKGEETSRKKRLADEKKMQDYMAKRIAMSLNQPLEHIKELTAAEEEAAYFKSLQDKFKSTNDFNKKQSQDRVTVLKEQYQTELSLAGNSVKGIQAAQQNLRNSLDKDYRAGLIGLTEYEKAKTDLIQQQNKTVTDESKQQLESVLKLGVGIMSALGPALDMLFDKSANIGEVLTEAFQGILKKLLSVAIAAAVAVAILSMIPGMIQPGKFLETYGNLVGVGMGLGSNLFSKKEPPKYANGGIISGPTMGLMGEYPGAQHNPEVVAPLDKLKEMIGGGQGNGQFVLRGQDLVLALQRSNSALTLRR